MSCQICGLLAGLKTNPLITAEGPYEAGARRGVVGGFALGQLVLERRIRLTLCELHEEQLRSARELLAQVVEPAGH